MNRKIFIVLLSVLILLYGCSRSGYEVYTRAVDKTDNIEICKEDFKMSYKLYFEDNQVNDKEEWLKYFSDIFHCFLSLKINSL